MVLILKEFHRVIEVIEGDSGKKYFTGFQEDRENVSYIDASHLNP